MDGTAINSSTACRNLIFYATNPFLPVAKKSLALYSFLKTRESFRVAIATMFIKITILNYL